MDLQLKGKKAIVTGGSAGMGKAIARQLAREGCDVVVGARTEARLQQASAEIAGETGRNIVPLVVDTLDAASIEAFIQRAAEALGTIHILANCAARVGGTIPDNKESISDEQIVKDFSFFVGGVWGFYPPWAGGRGPHAGDGHQHAGAQYCLCRADEVVGQYARSLWNQCECDLSRHDHDRSGLGAPP